MKIYVLVASAAVFGFACSESQNPSSSLSVYLPCESPADCGYPGHKCIKPSGGAGTCANVVLDGCGSPACTVGMKCVSQLKAQCTGCTYDVACIALPVPCSAFLPGTCTDVTAKSTGDADASVGDGN
jgi:hypothetical protein